MAKEASQKKETAAKKTTTSTAKKTTKKAAEATAAPAPKKVVDETKFKWYVVQSQSNYEKRVQAAIREQAIMHGVEDEIAEVLIPTEEVVEIKKGAKTTSERKFFPGYVLVRANMTDKVWHAIKGISRVTGFVGSGRSNKPLPISNREAERILKQMTEGVEKPRPLVNFEVGEEVRVIDGPFNTFQGVVEEVDEERSRLKVSVSIFGRATPIELEYTQVEKI